MAKVEIETTTMIFDKNGKQVAHFESLNCGHQNNLKLDGKLDDQGTSIKRQTTTCPVHGVEF